MEKYGKMLEFNGFQYGISGGVIWENWWRLGKMKTWIFMDVHPIFHKTIDAHIMCLCPNSSQQLQNYMGMDFFFWDLYSALHGISGLSMIINDYHDHPEEMSLIRKT